MNAIFFDKWTCGACGKVTQAKTTVHEKLAAVLGEAGLRTERIATIARAVTQHKCPAEFEVVEDKSAT